MLEVPRWRRDTLYRGSFLNRENNRSRKQNVKEVAVVATLSEKNRQSTLHEITMFNENCGRRGTRGGARKRADFRNDVNGGDFATRYSVKLQLYYERIRLD